MLRTWMQAQFLCEKQTEPYKWYGEGSITAENGAWRQEAVGSGAPHLSRAAGSKLVYGTITTISTTII